MTEQQSTAINRLCLCGHRELDHATAFEVGPSGDPGSKCGVSISSGLSGNVVDIEGWCRCVRFRPALGEPSLKEIKEALG